MRILFVVISILSSLSISQADQWYEDVVFIRSDPFQFDSQRSVLFPTSGLHLKGHPATGKLYATIEPETLQQLEDSSKHALVLDSHTLTSKEAATYRKFFHDAPSMPQIPWILGAFANIPSAVSTSIGITATVLDALSRYDLANQKISAQALEQLMSTDGRFELTLVLTHDPADNNHRYITSTIVYTVKVGNEVRTYAICSSGFALQST